MKATPFVGLLLFAASVGGCEETRFDRESEERRVLVAILEAQRAGDSSIALAVVRDTFISPPIFERDSVAPKLQRYGIERRLARAFAEVAMRTDSLRLPLGLSYPEMRDTISQTGRMALRDSLMRVPWVSSKDNAQLMARLYPGAGGVYSFSHAGFSRDRKWALLYMEYFCGMLCAQGDYVVLERVQDAWIIRARHNLWVS